MSILGTTTQYQNALRNWQGIQDAPDRANRGRRFGMKVMNSNLLERCVTTAHWSLPGLWSIPLVAFLLYRAAVPEARSPDSIAGLFLAGVLGWTFAEYWLHRWVFHLAPARQPAVRTVQFALHGYHHEFPDDPRRLVAPPILAVPIGSFLAAVVMLVFPSQWAPILAGVFSGYLCYDWVHYYCHHGRPRSRIGKFMRRFHLEHHYRDANSQFGLSSPLWDLAFRTYRRPGQPTPAGHASLAGDVGSGN